jgi:hypothetical protein
MKNIKYILKLLILPAGLILQSCTSTISLNLAPSKLALVSIQPNSMDIVQYNVTSDVDDPYEYKNALGHKYFFPINRAFQDNIKIYMVTKFDNRSNFGRDKPSVTIDIALKSFDLDYHLKKDFSDTHVYTGEVVIDVVILSHVKIIKHDKVLGEKDMESVLKYDETIDGSSNIDHVYSRAVNSGLSKHILMLDKYLVSLGL